MATASRHRSSASTSEGTYWRCSPQIDAPSWGVGSVLLIGTVAVGTVGAFVRRLNHTEEERQAEELARTVNAIASQVAALTTLPAAEAALRLRARPRAVWNVLVHGEGNH